MSSRSRRSRVLIVDDSLDMCRFVERALARDPTLEVVGHAHDPFEARGMIKRLRPDVLTLAVQLPRMDGLTFLRNLMRLHPLPTVILSSLTAAGAQVTLDALQAGAVDAMVKRRPDNAADLERYAEEIAQRVARAARTRPRRPQRVPREEALPDLGDCRRKLRGGRAFGGGVRRLVGIGASVGGPEAIRHVLRGLDVPGCAVAICQHMHGPFVASFAERLDGCASLDVRLAEDGEPLEAGRCYVAPGDRHLRLAVSKGRACWRLGGDEPLHGHRPAIDALFSSIADGAAERSVLVLLTGMGDDGADALVRARRHGAVTVVQDELSSTVWGMPGRAWEMGGGDVKLGLGQIGPALTSLLGREV